MTNNPFILIVGRSGAGKDTYANILKENGLKGVLSYTTRPKRYINEDTHIFIKPNEADSYTDKVAVTHISNYEYFATKEQVDNCDYYIIDPNGVRELLANYKNLDYIIIYLYCDLDVRKERALSRSSDAYKELEIFNKRNKSENGQFNAFEKEIYQYQNVIIHNTTNIDIKKLRKLAVRDIKMLTNNSNDDVDIEILAQRAGFSSAAEMSREGYIINY